MHFRAALVAFAGLVSSCGGGGGSTPESPGGGGPPNTGPTFPGPALAGCAVFPSDNEWNRDVSSDPVDANSAAYIANIGATRFLHPDFGSDPTYGIPWTTVPASQPLVPMSFDYDDESDPGPYPFPRDAPVEAGGDSHVLVLQQGACKSYEPF